MRNFPCGQIYAKYGHMFCVENSYFLNYIHCLYGTKTKRSGRAKVVVYNNCKYIRLDKMFMIYSQKINIEVNVNRL